MSRTAQVSIALAVLLLVFAKLLYDLSAAAHSGLVPNLANDALNWAWPYYNYASASIRSGVFPLWNPYTAVGSPFVADLSVALFNPLNWIVLLADVPTGLVLLQLFTVFVGMTGMYCYTRYLQLPWPARLLSCTLFAYALFTEAFHPTPGGSLCWFPTLLWLTHRFLNAPGLSKAVGISVVLALCFLAGFPNFFLYTCMVLFVYGAVVLLGIWPQIGAAGVVSRAAILVPALLLVPGLAAVQLLPGYELTGFSVRAIELGSAFRDGSLFERFSLALMFRNYLETDLAYVYALPDIRVPSGIYYLGGALLLLPFAFAARKYRTVSIALGSAFVFMSLFMLSTQVPALSFLQAIPLADSLRMHGRGVAYTQSLLIVLAGIGLAALYERAQSPAVVGRSRALLGALLFVAYAAVLLSFAFQILDNKYYVASLVICALLIVYVLLRSTGSSWAMRCCLGIALVIVVDASVHRSNRFLVPAFAADDDAFITSNAARAKAAPGHYRVFFVPLREGAAYRLANLGPKYQVPNISAYTPMVLARWGNFLRYLGGEQEYDHIMSSSLNQRFYGALTPPLQSLLAKEPMILDMASLRYWIAKSGNRESATALPRAYAVRHFIQTQDEAGSLAAIKANLPAMAGTVVLEGASPSFPSAAQPERTQRGDVVITLHEAQRVDMDVDVAEPSIVVLTDAYYPGWEAYVDGQATTVFRANSVFRAVEVPAGEHNVSFRFRPRSFFWGMTISLASMGLVIALVVLDRARRRHSQEIR